MAQEREEIVVFSSPLCPPCEQLKTYLRSRGIKFAVRDVMVDEEAAEFLESRNIRSTPVLSVNGELVVGFERELIDELLAGARRAG
jgi:glutaredoxin 3